jgi:hypothetical protein
MVMTMRVLRVDIVVPVRNEEHDLAPSMRRLVSYLRQGFPFTARVTIADNGSTWAIADRPARDFDEVWAVRMEQPGRGRALRAVTRALEILDARVQMSDPQTGHLCTIVDTICDNAADAVKR